MNGWGLPGSRLCSRVGAGWGWGQVRRRERLGLAGWPVVFKGGCPDRLVAWLPGGSVARWPVARPILAPRRGAVDRALGSEGGPVRIGAGGATQKARPARQPVAADQPGRCRRAGASPRPPGLPAGAGGCPQAHLGHPLGTRGNRQDDHRPAPRRRGRRRLRVHERGERGREGCPGGGGEGEAAPGRAWDLDRAAPRLFFLPSSVYAT